MLTVTPPSQRNDLPWGDKQIARFQFRVQLFQRRGWDLHKAETYADRLAERDHERDDRHLCVECVHLQRSGGCFAATQGWLINFPAKTEAQQEHARRFRPVQDMLERCERFDWVTPN